MPMTALFHHDGHDLAGTQAPRTQPVPQQAGDGFGLGPGQADAFADDGGRGSIPGGVVQEGGEQRTRRDGRFCSIGRMADVCL